MNGWSNIGHTKLANSIRRSNTEKSQLAKALHETKAGTPQTLSAL